MKIFKKADIKIGLVTVIVITLLIVIFVIIRSFLLTTQSRIFSWS